MEREVKRLYIKYTPGMDIGRVLRIIDGTIVNGRIHFTGVTVDDGEVYWVKDCGDTEVIVPMPIGGENMVMDLDGRGAIGIEVRAKA